jgi:hypothetical protein
MGFGVPRISWRLSLADMGRLVLLRAEARTWQGWIYLAVVLDQFSRMN